MTRSRLVVTASFAAVGLGVAVALGALVLDPARAAVGPMPGEGLALPSGTRFVVGIDVARFTSSPMYQKHAAKADLTPEAFAELEEKTGLRPDRDIDQILIAGAPPAADGPARGAVLVFGRFDRYKLSRAIEADDEKKNVSWKTVDGYTVYVFGEGRAKGRPGALAFLDDDTLVLGPQATVEEVIANRNGGGKGLAENAELVRLLGTVRPGSTFWMVGDQTLLSRMPNNVPSPMGGGQMSLPALKSLVVTGDLDPEMALHATGEARDEAAARQLADVVRGMTALIQLQGGQNPALQSLATAFSVNHEGTKVHVNARLPYELLDQLKAMRPQGKAPQASAPAEPLE